MENKIYIIRVTGKNKDGNADGEGTAYVEMDNLSQEQLDRALPKFNRKYPKKDGWIVETIITKGASPQGKTRNILGIEVDS
tara:strand:+ start:1758 stop:2000 length:243 start_codon:yes stop_codon:yes gene_type:complete